MKAKKSVENTRNSIFSTQMGVIYTSYRKRLKLHTFPCESESKICYYVELLIQ